MIVVAVEHLDVDAGFRHPSGELAQLTRNRLLESLNDDLTLSDHPDAGFLERHSRGRAIGEQEVSDTAPIDDPRPSTLDAHTFPSQRLAHLGKRTGPIVEFNREILDRRPPNRR
jgi:hypothetical protein